MNETTNNKTSPDKSNYEGIGRMLVHALEFAREHPQVLPSVQSVSTATEATEVAHG